jgi:hypothetical protein
MKSFDVFRKPQPVPSRVVLRSRIETAFAELLQSKHLYQSVQVDFSTTGVKRIEEAAGNQKLVLLQEWSSLHSSNWIPRDPQEPPSPIPFPLSDNLDFRPPDIKTFCSNCNRIEAFNLASVENFLARGGAVNVDLHNRYGIVVQVFVLSYVCQSCKSVPDVFVVRREGPKLTLSGRTPIEHVDVPKVIPKSVATFYSGAIVAHQSGQTLAGIFLLRTLLEQYAYTKSTNPQSADDAIDQYMNGLPADFKARFPSFRDLYSALSVDIHTAKGSPSTFDDSISKIIKHFEARRLYDLP